MEQEIPMKNVLLKDAVGDGKQSIACTILVIRAVYRHGN